MSRLIFDNIPDASAILELRREALAGYVMEHLQALGGNPLKQQHSHPNNLAGSIVDRYPQSARDNLHKAIFSACKWLIKKDYLAETDDQGFFEISEKGNRVSIAADLIYRDLRMNDQAANPVTRSEVPGRNEPPRIFISYSRKQKKLVRELEGKLRSAGAEVWVDHRGIRGGDNLPVEINNALQWCNTLLLIWSAASAGSDWVQTEWTNAFSLRKKIIPCLFDNTPLPAILSHKAFIDISDVAEGTAELLEALELVGPQNETSEQLTQINEQDRVIEERIDTDLKKVTKQPRGLRPLLFTQMCERLSYYGCRAVLVLYMSATLASGGLGFDRDRFVFVYVIFSLSNLIAPLGGLLADYVLRARWAVLVGGILTTSGYLTLLPRSQFTFYVGLALIVLGTGLWKPNLPVMVGRLYPANDLRRDGGFCLYYVSVHIGALVGPLLCGFLVYSESFKNFLHSLGLNIVNTWFLGFTVAALTLAIGTISFFLKTRHSPDAANSFNEDWTQRDGVSHPRKATHWRRIVVIVIFLVFAVAYWWAYEQGEGLLVGAEHSRSDVIPIRFDEVLKSGWKANVITILIIIFAPLIAFLWVKLRERQPSSLGKFALGLLIGSGAHLLFIPVLTLTAMGRIHQVWLLSVYMLEVVGELCVVPTTLSLVTRISPPKLAGTMVGFWSITTMLGSMLSGRVGSQFFSASDPWALVNLYGLVALVLLVLGLVTVAITPTIKRLLNEA